MSRTDYIAGQIAAIMPRIARTITSSFSKAHQLPPSQIFAILTLDEKGSCRFSELSESLRVAAPTVTGIIGRLAKGGFVTRVHDKEDRRAINVQLTVKGSKVAQEIRKIVKTRWFDILSGLPKSDQENYLRIVTKIHKKL
ncbi:MAG: MarR family transcriptional regulator [Candidatus Omnitrophica bacterium]|nr:MarR family transcriptional regulator [Candidatus Omnitrophota bacterium]